MLYVLDNLRWVDKINLTNNLLITCQYIQFICSLCKASVSSKRLKYLTFPCIYLYLFRWSCDCKKIRYWMESPAKRQKVLSSIERACLIYSKQTSETYLTKAPSPRDCKSWSLSDDGELQINLMTEAPATNVVLQFLSFKCKKSCKLPSCQCMVNALPCTQACTL